MIAYINDGNNHFVAGYYLTNGPVLNYGPVLCKLHTLTRQVILGFLLLNLNPAGIFAIAVIASDQAKAFSINELSAALLKTDLA